MLVPRTHEGGLVWKKGLCRHYYAKDLEMRRPFWIIWVGSKSADKCPVRGTQGIFDEKTQTRERG